MTREVRAGHAQDVTRTSSEDHIGGDVATRRDGADENSGGHPSSVVPDSRTRTTTETSNRAQGSSGKQRHKSAQLLSPLKRHSTGTVRNDEDRES